MKKGLIGKKIGMTQIFDDKGNVVPVTVVEAGPCPVVQIKTVETDGYAAAQIGYGDVKPQRVNKPQAARFKKADVAPKKVLREFKFDDIASYNVGDILKADTFAAGDIVDVVGTSKGKGTAGAIKRWNFSRLKESHGTGPVARHAGSLGACSDPSRVYKGKICPCASILWHRARHFVNPKCILLTEIFSYLSLSPFEGAVVSYFWKSGCKFSHDITEHFPWMAYHCTPFLLYK